MRSDIGKITFQILKRKTVVLLCKMKRNLNNSSEKMYEETISALKDLKSIASYITSLGKIMNKIEDKKLQKLLEEVIIEL